MNLSLTNTNMSSQYYTSRLQNQIASQQSEIQEQQSQIQSQQQELQKYTSKTREQQQEIQEQDLLIHGQNQTLQHEKMKKASNNRSIAEGSASYKDLEQHQRLSKTLRIPPQVDQTSQLDNVTCVNSAAKQQAIQTYQANQLLTQIPIKTAATKPLNLLA